MTDDDETPADEAGAGSDEADREESEKEEDVSAERPRWSARLLLFVPVPCCEWKEDNEADEDADCFPDGVDDRSCRFVGIPCCDCDGVGGGLAALADAGSGAGVDDGPAGSDGGDVECSVAVPASRSPSTGLSADACSAVSSSSSSSWSCGGVTGELGMAPS